MWQKGDIQQDPYWGSTSVRRPGFGYPWLKVVWA